MSKESDPPSDSDLFRQAVGKVRRMDDDKTPPAKPDIKPIPRQLIADEEQVLEDMLSDHYTVDLQPGDILSYMQPGIQKTVFKKLRTGKYRIDAELDLHGMRSTDARVSIQEFLAKAKDRRWRCVRVIHGKGLRSSNKGPVLKGLVNQWLRQRDDVLAFHSTPPEAGGTGAVYVLVKSAKND